MSEPYRIEVDGCLQCPFFRYPTQLCVMPNGNRRVDTSLILPPPDWCPLRTRDHLVTLRVK